MTTQQTEIFGPDDGGAKYAALPDPSQERFTLGNRSSVTAWLRAHRINLIDPAAPPRELATAALLIVTDPAHAPLVAQCEKMTKILEIAPDGWTDDAIRDLCNATRRKWALLTVSTPAYPLSRPLAFGARVPMTYEIPVARLSAALHQLGFP